MEKICCKCKQILNVVNFGKLKTSPDGLRYDCKFCRKNYREKNKEEIKQKQQSYYLENKNTLIEKK